MSARLRLVVHGGVGSPVAWKDGCKKAIEAAWPILTAGGSALQAAVKAVAVLEDDGRFNAGVGANLRMDGETVERDAGVMDSRGKLGAVCALAQVRHPVAVALAVTDTPHTLLAGEGALAFARKLGHKPFLRVPAGVRKRFREAGKRFGVPGSFARQELWRKLDLEQVWNFEAPPPEWAFTGTVGAVAADASGGFATANSTGGTSYMLRGRVGDSPLVGSGYFAGPHGAVAATGVGEEIARKVLSKQVYDWMAAGRSPRDACSEALALFSGEIPVGLIAVGPAGLAHAANRAMAWAKKESTRAPG